MKYWTGCDYFMSDNYFTSDFLIYNILKNCDDEIIQNCNLKFIDRSVPASEDNTIYIANVDLELLDEMFDSSTHRALVNLYVKTKDTGYVRSSRFLRTVIKHIKHVLRNDDECKSRNIVFRNVSYEYGSKYTLKGMHLLIQLMEHESYDLDDEFECVNIEDDEMEIDVR